MIQTHKMFSFFNQQQNGTVWELWTMKACQLGLKCIFWLVSSKCYLSFEISSITWSHAFSNFTGQGIVISYTSTLFHDKSHKLKLGFHLIGSTVIIWNQSQTISHCINKTCSSLKWKVKIVYPLKRSFWLVRRQ